MSSYWEATVSTQKTRLVFCEKCDTQYVYDLTITATENAAYSFSWSQETQKKEAMDKAKKTFKENLKYSCKAVPCPECAHVQKHMVKQAQQDFAMPGYMVAVGLFFLAIIVAIIGKVAGIDQKYGLWLFGLVGISLVVAGVSYALGAMHDPNTRSEEKRLAVADKECQRRADFEKTLQKAVRKMFDKQFKKFERKHDAGELPSFALPFWADREQVADGVKRTIVLPHGEEIKMPLEADMRDGEELEIRRTVDGVPIAFGCVLNIYTETREKK